MMNSTLLRYALVALLAAGLGWWAGRRSDGAATIGGRKIAFYQSSMHPWIKSDKPGKCTICGMDLTPIPEGEEGFAVDGGLLTLSPTNITVADVRTEAVRRQPLRRTLNLAGTISVADNRRAFVSARLDGQVETVLPQSLLGPQPKGTPLAVISGKDIADVQREFISLERGDNVDKLLGGELERTRLLNLARERLRELGFTDEQIAALPQSPQLDTKIEVRAPIDGTVAGRWVYDGLAVKQGQRLFEIVDLSSVWFKFDAYEGDMSWLAPLLEVEITTPSVPGQTFRGTIEFIEPAIGDMVRSLKGRAVLENSLVTEAGRERWLLRDRELAQGVVAVEAADVLAIPRSAVLSPGGSATVYVEKSEGVYEPRPVTLGRTGDTLVEVLGGLKEGETVVTAANLLIDAQAQINQSAAPPAAPGAEPAAPIAPPTLTELQERKATDLFGIAATMASALARDNLEQYNQQLPALEAAILPLIENFADVESVRALVAEVEKNSHAKRAANLEAARRDFLAFSNPLVAFAKALRPLQSFAYLRVYHCPMVDSAIDGVGPDGFWIQAAPPMRNPFFGAEMLECGVEVKAPAAGAPAPASATATPAPAVQAAPRRDAGSATPAPVPAIPSRSRYP